MAFGFLNRSSEVPKGRPARHGEGKPEKPPFKQETKDRQPAREVPTLYNQDEERYQENIRRLNIEENNRLRNERKYRTFRKQISPFLNSYLHRPMFDHVYHRVQEEYRMEILIFISFIAYAFVSYLLFRVYSQLPLLLHAAIIYSGDGFIVPGLCMAFWLLWTIIKFTEKKPEVSYMEAYHAFGPDTKVSDKGIHLMSLLFTLLLAGFTAYIEYTNTWHTAGGIWVLIMAAYIIRLIPGAGAHSTSGMVFVVAIFGVCLLMSPTIFGALSKSVRTLTEAPTVEEVRPLFDIPRFGARYLGESYSRELFRIPRLGISETSLSDAIRHMTGGILLWWLVFDDTLAPGAVTLTMVDMVMKRAPSRDIKGGVRCCANIIMMLVQVAWYLYWQDIFSFVVLALAAPVSFMLWKWQGEPRWNERGAQAGLVNLRADTLILKSSVDNVRVILCTLCIIVGGLMLVVRLPEGTVGWVVLLMSVPSFYSEKCATIVLGLMSGNYVLVFPWIFSRYPITKSYKDCAYPASEDTSY